jgi:hypothetical protein
MPRFEPTPIGRGRHEPAAARGGPPSTHSSVHLLVGLDSLPRVSANAVRGAQLAIDETVFLHVEAEHRTFSFDHTATFTVSGPRGAIDRLLLQLRAALASLPPDDASGADAGNEPGEAERD